MSFRRRLTLFFVVIVIVPMLSVALVLFRLISDNETGKADSGLVAAAQSATGLYRIAATDARARTAIAHVAADRAFARGLSGGASAAAERQARRLLGRERIVRLTVLRGGRAVVDAGSPAGIAPAIRDLIAPDGRALGRLEVSVEKAAHYARTVRRTTGLDVVVSHDGHQLAATLSGVPARLPSIGGVRVAGRRLRAASFVAQGLAGQRLEVSVLAPRSRTDSAISRGRLIAGAILLGFLALACAFALLVSRSLQRQVGGFLEAARRLARGDFSARVPVVGADEFAGLGEEFNRMSGQLEARLEELRGQRARMEDSLRRIGETFASNLDRDALLGIVLRTAVDGVGAQVGRASVGEPPRECASVGTAGGLEDVLAIAERAASATRSPRFEHQGPASAIAQPLLAADGSGRLLGVIAVARTEGRFDAGERELLDYLARQASVSIENVSLHEQVQRQAMTDELTGLLNHRSFHSALVSEIERAKRFGHPVGLVMLDLDDFKQVNDSYGHQQGDRVLQDVSRLLRDYSREIDSPARYGGEELALVLPETDLRGTYRLAERLRHGIEHLEIPVKGGNGSLRITASLGVAAMRPSSPREPSKLIAAADSALYEAKRAGKNRTVRGR